LEAHEVAGKAAGLAVADQGGSAERCGAAAREAALQEGAPLAIAAMLAGNVASEVILIPFLRHFKAIVTLF